MNSKPKTLVVIDNLYTGGVATSLYSFLYFARDLMSIYLLVFNEESIDRTKIPNNVEIVMPCKWLHILGKKHSDIKQESCVLTIYRLIMVFVARVLNGVMSRKLLWPFIKECGDFDVAIAYAQDDSYKSISKGCIDYVVKKVHARHKSVIVHCDYKNFGGYNPRQIYMLNKLNTIICVSESCRKSFVECFPSLTSKTIVCENFTKVNDIIELAGRGVNYSPDLVNFVSVCRLSEEKGLDRTVKAFGELYRNGITGFTWTIVGGGPEYDKLQNLIEDEQLTSKISLVGNKDNPYPFIVNASCFLLPSFHEAAPMVFAEAACLGVPVLSTETCSAIELVQNRKIGVVVSNNYIGLLKGLESTIKNPLNNFNMDASTINIHAFNQLNDYIQIINSNEKC